MKIMTDQTKDQAAQALKDVNTGLKNLTEKVQPMAENALNEAKKLVNYLLKLKQQWIKHLQTSIICVKPRMTYR
jgi:F0F1-type ATP synthase membrane subunit b/b'